MPAKLDKDILKQPAPKHPPKLTSRRIGIHTSTAGGVENAAERAYRLGCNTLQIFSSSPRQWKPYELGASQCEVMNGLRQKYDLRPLVIHTNYLVNVAAINPGFHEKSILAFRAEVERALALCADYLVLHPGSYRGMSREEGLQRAAAAIDVATQAPRSEEGWPYHSDRKHCRGRVLAWRILRASRGATALPARDRSGCGVPGHVPHACCRVRHRERRRLSRNRRPDREHDWDCERPRLAL